MATSNIVLLICSAIVLGVLFYPYVAGWIIKKIWGSKPNG